MSGTRTTTVGGAGPTRREVVGGAGVAAGALLLAACGGGSPSGSTGGQDGGAGATSGGGGTAGGGVAAGTSLAAVSDVPVGGALSATLDGSPVLVTQPEDGELHAFGAICPHQGCTVGPGDGELLCPCHASRFDLATGAVLGGPAPEGLPEIPVTVTGDEVTTA